MSTVAGILIGLGAVAAAVFIGRQLEANAQSQIAALKAAANQGAGVGDYLSVGVQVGKVAAAA